MSDDAADSKTAKSITKSKSNGDDGSKAAASLDTVGSLGVHEQVELLAQALLREFMHRRGYTKTLRAFDAECPRDERTISSRQLMRQLLEIPSNAFPSRLSGGEEADDGKGKKEKKAQPTFMEELCSYRVQKREVEQRRMMEKEGGEGPSIATNKEGNVGNIIDPSDAEMEGLRSAALDVERRIEEARERHEKLLEERRERKREKKRAEKKSKNKDKGRSKDGNGDKDSGRGGGSGGGKGKLHEDEVIDFDPFGSDDNGVEDGDDGFFTRRTNTKKKLPWPHDDDDEGSDSDLYGLAGGKNGSSYAGKGSSRVNNLLEEPEFLLNSIEKRKTNRAGTTQVGSGWTPGGGGLGDVGLNTMPMRQSVEADIGRPPSFLAGDGMSLMTERMQVDKKPRDTWRPPAPLPSNSMGGGGSGGLRGSAGFRGELSGSPTNPSPLGSVAFGQRGLNGGGTRFHHGSAPSVDCLGPPLVAGGLKGEKKGASPPGSGGILMSSSESIGKGYDGSLRPTASALRQSGASKNKDGGEGNGNGTTGRKARRVTILVD